MFHLIEKVQDKWGSAVGFIFMLMVYTLFILTCLAWIALLVAYPFMGVVTCVLIVGYLTYSVRGD